MARKIKVRKVLQTRGKSHGSFFTQAQTSQAIKRILRATPNWEKLDDDMKECMEMEALKLSRTLHGDPEFDDHWVDRAGYTTLVADRLIEKNNK